MKKQLFLFPTDQKAEKMQQYKSIIKWFQPLQKYSSKKSKFIFGKKKMSNETERNINSDNIFYHIYSFKFHTHYVP